MTELLQAAVLLCKGSVCVKGKLPVMEVSRSLQGYRPSMPVVIGDRLCEPGALSRHLPDKDGFQVIAACSRVADGCEEIGVPAWQVTIVEALKEFNSPLPPSETTERIKRLVWAQVNRAGAAQVIPRDALRLRTIGPDEKLSRRELFRMGRQKYEVIPYIDPGRCGRNRRQGCGLCATTCPSRAIIPMEGKWTIEKGLCRGCGACAVACPRNAVVYPTFSLDQMDREMEGLLHGEPAPQPQIIAFTCDEGRADAGGYPATVLPLQVPCLAMVSPWLFLRAFDRGAQGVVMITPGKDCGLKCDVAGQRNHIHFIQELFRAWSIEPSRIELVGPRESRSDALERDLHEFIRTVETLPALRLKGRQPSPIPEKGLPLAALIQDMMTRPGRSRAGNVARGSAPFGKADIDRLRCTGCGLCGLDCPTGALTFLRKSDPDSYQMLFQHDRCTGCGLCVKSCPEHCLHVERGLDLGVVGAGPWILFQDEISSCRECGTPLFPRAMIARLKAKLSAAGESTWAVERCPSCRLKSPLARQGVVDGLSQVAKEITI